MIKTLNVLLQSFEDDLTPDNAEDETLAAVLDTAQVNKKNLAYAFF